MPPRTQERLLLEITARDDASKVVRKVEASVKRMDKDLSSGTLQKIGDVSSRTFGRIQQDVNLATQDFKRGVISIEQYTQALQFARQEAMELKAGGLQPVGTELKAFNSVVRATGGNATGASRGVGTLRGAMGSLAASAAGLPGRLGEVSSIIGQFAWGSLATAGVFAGLAAVALAFRTITQDARDAKREAEEAKESFLGLDPLGRLRREEIARGLRETQIELSEGLRVLSAGGRILNPDDPQGRRFVPLRTKERTELEARVVELQNAVDDYIEAFDKERMEALKREREQAEREAERARREAERERRDAERARQARIKEFNEAAKGTASRTFIERGRQFVFGDAPSFGGRPAAPLPGPERFTMRGMLEGQQLGMAQLGGAGALAGVQAQLLAGTGGVVGAFQVAVDKAGGDVAKSMERFNKLLKEAAEDSKRKIVGAFAIAANALAGMITGRTSIFGGLGGISAGLSVLPGIGQGLGMGLGIAGIGFSFIDALTSDRNKNTMKDAHLQALREHERDKPPATIFVNVDPFDPTNREHQRVIDEARREAESEGFRVKLGGSP